MKTKLAIRSRSDHATMDDGKVRLGDMAPAFTNGDSCQPNAKEKKVVRDAATEDGGKVRLGDMAPLF